MLAPRQRWPFRIKRVLEDLLGLAAAVPSFIVVYNSNGAGASLPEHFHYQAFELPEGHGPLPIQQAASLKVGQPGERAILALGCAGDYPIRAFKISGADISALVEQGASLLSRWYDIQGSAAAANLIATSEEGRPSLYFVPRNLLFRKTVGFNGELGSTEVCGLFIASSRWELSAIRSGAFNMRRWRVSLPLLRPPPP